MTRSGRDPELLVGEERARAPHSGLNLVDAQERPDFERELRGGLRKRRLERDHAALPQNGLEQDQRRLACGSEGGLE